MWHNKINELNAVRINQGFLLIELLLSLSLGTFLLIIFFQFYTNTMLSQNKQRELINLQQNSHQILHYMQQHIQHIGYQGSNRENSNLLLFQLNGRNYQLINPQCFVFFYDLNGDGCVGSRNKKQQCEINQFNNTKEVNKEIFGFAIKNNNLYIFDDGDFNACYKNQCQNWASGCSENRWGNVSELSDYKVERLHFSWEKEGVLLKIELTLSSIIFSDLKYTAIAYSYLLNGIK